MSICPRNEFIVYIVLTVAFSFLIKEYVDKATPNEYLVRQIPRMLWKVDQKKVL